MTALAVITAVLVTAAVFSRAYRALHMIQLEGYRLGRYFRHSAARLSWRKSLLGLVFLASLMAGALGYVFGLVQMALAPAAVGVVAAATLTFRTWTRPAKKPLVVTARMGRILGMTSVLTLAVCAGCTAVAYESADSLGTYGMLLMLSGLAGALVLAEPMAAAAAVVALEPLEERFRRRFVAEARCKLNAVSPIVVGIAGSYGKTTTKAALAAALAGRYNVLASPDSYNTLLGVTKTINEMLTDDVQVLIVEMGARQPGDISAICELVRPTIGVITRLGPQHLEYFKTEAAVVETKTELLRALPDDGIAVVDADGLTDFSQPHGWKARTVRVSTRPETSPDILVSGIALDGDGTVFAASKDGVEIPARTRLLGRHAAANCGLAMTTALELGVDAPTIQDGLAALAPVPHRLEIVRNDAVIVIDDAFSSNPAGFGAALEVLGSFPGRHLLVTPGMVELGGASVAAHVEIAHLAARVCDVIILVGTAWPKEFPASILRCGFPNEALRLVDTLADATAVLAGFVRPGDVVLFENDLPDNLE